MKQNLHRRGAIILLAIAALLVPFQSALADAYIPGSALRPTDGTAAWIEHYTWQGLDRTAIVIRPDPAPAGKAPAIVLMHFHGGTSAVMANLARAGSLSVSRGYWIILPQGVDKQWNDNPDSKNNTVDDVGFLAKMIKSLTTKYAIDATRVSMAGFSGGGFMATRFICQHADMVASVFSVAASMRVPVRETCAPSRPVPIAFVLGQNDPVVNYYGNEWVIVSAADTYQFWAGINGCDMVQSTTINLPTKVKDGTSVVLQHDAACNSGGEIDLYTVRGGGHDWPDGSGNPYNGKGIESQNLNTTAVMGRFASQWTTQSTH